MEKGTSVKEYVLDMMVHFNVVEMNTTVIDEYSQVSFMLETLLKSFLQFRSNVVMNKIDCNLTTLLNELQTYYPLMKNKGLEGEANVVSSNKNLHRGLTSKAKFGASSLGT